MTLQNDTLIELVFFILIFYYYFKCNDQDIDIPSIQYNFIKISDITNVTKDALIGI